MNSIDTSRKRKQDFGGEVNKTSWMDYVNSPPDSALDFTFDSIFPSLDGPLPSSFDYQQPSSRRHSVAVADLDHLTRQRHQQHPQQQEFNAHHQPPLPWEANFSHLIGSSMPSSWSSSASSGMSSFGNMPQHHRTTSLRLETPTHDVAGNVSAASPTTPVFFPPSFLEALNAEEDAFSPTTSYMSTSLFSEPDMMMGVQTINTITPSVLSNASNSTEATFPWATDEPKPNNQKQRTSKSTPPTSPSSHTAASSMSPTPSPPVTPLQPTTFPVIPEEDENGVGPKSVANGHRSKSSVIASRVEQGLASAANLKPLIQQYLLDQSMAAMGERTVMILTSKVAQKSYGTEKRFLCPPPSTVLSGANWWTNSSESNATSAAEGPAFLASSLAAPKLTVNISGEATSQSGVIEWYTSSGTLLDASTPALTANNVTSGCTSISGKCVSKHLHINDADEKRKRVEVLVNVQLGNGSNLGTFASKGIKVISKPSKKRQSVKNLELCIHHGTTISLFNRIRSQTVSTKYLGVSNGKSGAAMKGGQGTCFVARTGSWDPFVIWIVDTSRQPDPMHNMRNASSNPNYPPPPAIALQRSSQQPIAIHYNQPVVLQCVNTGLVSPVMVIRKVDKGSMVLGGNRVDDFVSVAKGGECGDEALGDPVSQLHKVAFQIVQDPTAIQHVPSMDPGMGLYTNINEWTLPQTRQSVTYLACLNDVVGMHKTSTPRSFVTARPPPPSGSSSTPLMGQSWMEEPMFSPDLMSSVVSQDCGKVIRKRRVSCDVAKPMSLPTKLQSSAASKMRGRVNSISDASHVKMEGMRRGSITDRRMSASSDIGYQMDGACWTEDVSDAAVWTIVGTDCASYTFWTAQENGFNSPFQAPATSSSAITPFPTVNQVTVSSTSAGRLVTISGDHFARDLSIWFGDIRASRTDFKSRETITCLVPESELPSSSVITTEGDHLRRKLPILLVRGDGVVYRTDQWYTF